MLVSLVFPRFFENFSTIKQYKLILLLTGKITKWIYELYLLFYYNCIDLNYNNLDTEKIMITLRNNVILSVVFLSGTDF